MANETALQRGAAVGVARLWSGGPTDVKQSRPESNTNLTERSTTRAASAVTIVCDQVGLPPPNPRLPYIRNLHPTSVLLRYTET